MKKRLAVGGVIAVLVVTLFTLAALATSAEMYFSSDKNGANRVTNVQEGDQVWIAVYDPDENIDCDVRDKFWTDIKIMDPKTGAYIVWVSYMDENGDANGKLYANDEYVPYKGHLPGNNAGWLGADYMEETGADTGLFVSKRAFQVGSREDYGMERKNTHVVCDSTYPGEAWLYDFQWGHYLSSSALGGEGADRGWFDGTLGLNGNLMDWDMVDDPVFPEAVITGVNVSEDDYLVGRFENMDTLVGMYQDQNDDTDVAVGMMKIIDTEATISWDQEVYKDANTSATITVVDPDENLNCNKVEWVPVFIIVNPGAWNPVQTNSPTTFCMLKTTGGVDGADGTLQGDLHPIRWYNIYHSQKNAFGVAGAEDGRYYMQYDVNADFDTVQAQGITAVSFYAQETGVSTGVFQLNINSILDDLGFNSLRVRDVLVAYYLDPNDEDDFKLATAYIEEHQHSVTSFTDASRGDKSEYWIGRDPVYVQVIDANANVDPCCPEQVVVHICDVHGEDDSEWLIADETSSNSPVFFTNAGTQLLPVWDALGIGWWGDGFNLVLDNWKLEVFNEDSVYARYNDVYYLEADVASLGDVSPSWVDSNKWNKDDLGGTAFPPAIRQIRVRNDISFDTMEIGDTQVFDGSSTNMYFLDRQGNRVSGYVNSDCVFVEVVDSDQDEDQYRRERIDAFWDDAENVPFGPLALNEFGCGFDPKVEHPFNTLLGDTNVFNNSPNLDYDGPAKLYVLNPRNGRWASVDLLETGVATGDFVSVTCIDIVSQYDCVPTLGVLPGDTIIAAYTDPSNHSDTAWISIKIGIGGGGTPPSQMSTTMFVDADGNEVTSYTDADDAYVKVIDPSKAGAAEILDAVEISGTTYDLAPLADAATDTFITEAISGLEVGTFTATYTDPTDPTDTSSDTIDIIASELSVDSFYAGPNPFETEVTFGYNGSGIADTFTVTVYDLSGHQVWTDTQANVDHITWDGSGLANGGYIYVVVATGTDTFTGKGTVFINK